MDIGEMILGLKDGQKCCREGWNGQGMFLYYVPAAIYESRTDVAKREFGCQVAYQAYIAMKTVDGTVVPWLASQSDLLAKDWIFVNP